MFTVIAFSALIIAVVSMFLAIAGRYKYFWLSAIGIYIFSFIAGFSIGQMTVGLTFIPLALGIGHSFGWIQNKSHTLIFAGVGILIGILLVLFVDDAWLFFPFWILMR